MKNIKVGIAFGGGGGKGAWQLGVWKALAERGFYAEAVSGTSVGALNAALYSAFGKEKTGWEKGLQAWKEISPQTILPKNNKIVEKLFIRFPSLRNFGLFGSDGIETLIQKYLPLSESSRKSNLPIFITAHCQDGNKCEYFNLFSPEKAYTNDEIKQILLASTAIPFIFDPQEIRGKFYSDGGFDPLGYLTDDIISTQEVDNCPVEPLLDPGNELHLDMVFALPLKMNEVLKYEHKSIYGVPVIPIMPSEDLGSCLNFDPKKVEEKMDLGYKDAKTVLEMLKNHFETRKISKEAITKIYGEAKKLNELQNCREFSFDDSFSLKGILDEIDNCDDKEELSSIAKAFSLPSTGKILQFRSSSSQDDIETSLIDTSIKEVLVNAEDDFISDWYIQAHSFLADVDAKAEIQKRQNFWQRFFHGLTGKNQETINSSLQKIAKSNYCILHLIDSIQRDYAKQGLLFSNLYQQLIKDENFQQNLQKKQTFSNMLLSRNMISIACKRKADQLEFNNRLKSLSERMDIQEWQNTRWGANRQTEMKTQTLSYRFCKIMLDYYKHFAYSINKDEKWDYQPLWNVMDNCELKIVESINVLHNSPLTVKEKQELTNECTADFRMGKKSEQIVATDFSTVIPVKKSSCSNGSIPTIQQLSLNLLERWKALQLCPYDPSCSGMKGKYKQYFEKLEKILPEEPIFSSYKPRLKDLKEKVSGFRLIIYMLGIYSSGKSSLLNAWLGDAYLPEDTGPETAVLLKLQYADSLSEQKLVVYDKDKCHEIILNGLTPDGISKTVKEYKDNSKYSELELHLHNSELKVLQANEIDLADMPGYASGIKGHESQLYTRLLDRTNNFSFIFCKSQNNEEGLRKEDEVFLKQIKTAPYCLLLTKAGQCDKEKRKSKLENLCERIEELKDQQPLCSDFTDCEEEEIGINGFKHALEAIIKHKDRQIFATYQKEFQTLCDDLQRDFNCFCPKCSSDCGLSDTTNEITQLDQKISETSQGIRENLLSECSIQQSCSSLLNSIKNELNKFSTAQELLASYEMIARSCVKDAVENKFNKIQNAFQNELGLGTLTCNLEINFSPPPKVELEGKPGWGWHLLFLYEYEKWKNEKKDYQTVKVMLDKHFDDNRDRIRTVWENNIKGIISKLEEAAKEKKNMLEGLQKNIQNEVNNQGQQRKSFENKKTIVCNIIKEFENDAKSF